MDDLINKRSFFEIMRAKDAIGSILVSVAIIIFATIKTIKTGIFPIYTLLLLLFTISYPILMYYWFKARRKKTTRKEVTILSLIIASATLMFGIFITYFGTKILLGLVSGFENLPKSSETISGIVSIIMGIGCIIFAIGLAKSKGVT